MLRCLMLNVKVRNEAECKPERDQYDECKNKKKQKRGGVDEVGDVQVQWKRRKVEVWLVVQLVRLTSSVLECKKKLRKKEVD